MATTINTTENTVSVTSAENDITVTNNNTGTSVSIEGNQVTSVTVGVAGVQGPAGPQGSPGSVEDTIAANNIIQPFNHITASGNISASGTIVASNLSGTNTGDQTNITGTAGTASKVDTVQSTSEDQHFITFVDSNNATAEEESIFTNNFLQVNPLRRLVTIDGRLLVQGSSISFESGSISASNNIFAAGDITASGTISSSGTIIASSFTGDGSGLTGVTSYTDADTQDFINSINIISSSAQIASDISGSFTLLSSSLETRLENVEAGSTSKTLLSGSAQIATEISGAFVATSASLASAIATNLSRNTGNTDTIGTNTTKITSLTAATSSYALKTNISGSLGPNATLIRSLTATNISGSFTEASASFSTRVTANDAKVGYTDSLVKTKLNTEGVISSSAQIASDISGSFTEASASFSTRVTANDAKVGYTDALVKTKLNTEGVLSGSSQVSLSGFDTDDLSEGSSNLYYTDVRVKTKLNTENVLSASAQIATEISGAFIAPSSSFSTRVSTLETNNTNTNTGDQDLSSYALIAKISGSFVAPSSSFSTRVSTLEGNVGQAVNTDSDVTFATISATSLTVTSITSSIVTSSILQTEGSNIFGDAATDTHTFNGNITASGNISASGNLILSQSLTFGEASNLNNPNFIESNHLKIGAGGNDFAKFTDNYVQIFAEGSNVFQVTGGSQKTIGLNANALDVDVSINTDGANVFQSVGSNDIVRIGGTTNYYQTASIVEHNAITKFQQGVTINNPNFSLGSGSAGLIISGSGGHIYTTGHITASGNISASGNIVANNGTFAGTVTANGTTLTGDQDLSSYALITKISGSFVAPSSSFSTRVSTLETNNTNTNTGDQDLSNLMLSANTASFAVTSSNVLFGHITASGDISASGTLTIGNIVLGSRLNANQIGSNGNVGNSEYGTLDGIDISRTIQTQFDSIVNVTGSYALTGSNVLFGNITASGDISASGTITANAFVGDGSGLTGLSAAAITSTANGADNRIATYTDADSLNGEANLTFDGTSLTVTGNVTASGDISASGRLTSAFITTGEIIGPGNNGVGINLNTSGDLGLTVGSNKKLFFNEGGNTGTSFTIQDNNEVTTFTVNSDSGHITSSGNISASGDVTANSFIGPLTGTATSASRSDAANKVYTSQDNSDAEHFVTFVDSNNAVHADEDVHTTNFLRVNPQRRELIVEGRIKIPGSDITLESGSISASRDIFAPDITASGTISSSGDIHSATIRYVANIHDANNNAMISGTSTNLSLGDISNGSNRTKITITDSTRTFAFTSDESTEQSYNMPGVVTTNMVRTKNLRGQSPLIIDPTSVIISASQQFALGVGGTTSSLFLTSSITSSGGTPRIGFNTREPQTDFDVSAREVQFQRPGERKGLKINDEGNIESFDKSAASATTGSEFILNYSRGVTINAQSMTSAGFGPFAAGEGGDSQAVDLFNDFTADKQNAVLENLESLGFITPPQVGDTIGSIRFIAQSGSSDDFDARSTGETAAIRAVVSDGGNDGVASDLIFSVAGKSGGAQQKLLLDANGNHEMTGSLTLDNVKINGVLQSRTNVNSSIGFAALSSDQDIEFKPNGSNMLTLAPDLINFNSGYANADFRVNANSGVQAAAGNIFIFGDVSEDGGKGYLGVGTGSPTERLHVVGNIKVDGNLVPASDDARTLGTASNRWNDVFAVSTTTGGVFEVGLRTEDIGKLETGTIVSWKDGKCIPSCKSEDNMVMGVIKQGKDEPIVLGAEPVLVTGKVEEGDYIVTSEVVGHGKAAKEGYIFKKNLFGRVIAQALESAEGDSSLIKCMIRKM